MTILRSWWAPALAALPLLVAIPAGAQDRSAQSPAASSSSQQQGSLVIEPIRNSFVIAPDVKVTDLDGTTRTLVGAYGGVLMEERLLLGAGGYWLANGSRGHEMGYGGFVAGWTVPAGRRVRVGVRGLVGGGSAMIPQTVSLRVRPGFDGHPFPWMGPGFDRDNHANTVTFTTVTRQVRYHTGFFVAEPQATLVLTISRWLALDAGAGYRAVAWANGFEHQLRGASGSLGLRIEP